MTPERFTKVLDEIGCAAAVADVPTDREAAQDQADAAETAALKLLGYRRRIHEVVFGSCDCYPDLGGRGTLCGYQIAEPTAESHPGGCIPKRAAALFVFLGRQCRRAWRIFTTGYITSDSATGTPPWLVVEGEVGHPPPASPSSHPRVEPGPLPPAPAQRAAPAGTNLRGADRG